MKKQILFTALLITTTFYSNSEIIYKKLDTVQVLKTDTSYGSGININIDEQNDPEFYFRYDKWNASDWYFHIVPSINVARVSLNGKENSFTVPYAMMYTEGDTMDSNSNFQNNIFMHPLLGDVEDSNFLNHGTKFIGAEIKINGNLHYCWIKLELSRSSNNEILKVLEYAFENVPGKSLIVGDGGTANNPIYVNEILLYTQNSIQSITQKGGQLQILSTVLPENASNKQLNWRVTNKNLASIDTNGLLTAISDGFVEVIAEASDGSSTTASIYVEISNQEGVGIDVSSPDFEILVYPQPANSFLHIRLINPSYPIKSVKVLNVNGRMLINNYIDKKHESNIDISSLSTGIYMLSVELMNNQKSNRIIAIY